MPEFTSPSQPEPMMTPPPEPRRQLPRPVQNRPDVRTGETPFEKVLRDAIERRSQEASFYHRVVRPALQRLSDRSSNLMKNANLDAIRFRLLQAGFPHGLRARDFMMLKIIGVATMPFLAMVYLPILSWIMGVIFPPYIYIGWIVLFAWVGFRAPDIWLAVLTKQRRMEIQLALPDMIDLITISVEAGLGLYAAIQRVSMRFTNPLSEEFLRSMQEVRLGRTNTEAMRDLVRRAEVEDLTMFISSLIQAETLGVPIANVLRAQSDRLRDKRRQRAREQAQKAPLKMLFPLAIFIFPALFVVILGPAFIKVLNSGW
jgi:tight adherence protein C